MSAVGACASAGNQAEIKNFLRARCEANGFGRDCRIRSLSSRRVFVESFVPAFTGSKVTLQFCLPNGHKIRAKGVVSDHTFQVGFNVDLVDLSASDRDQIDSLMA